MSAGGHLLNQLSLTSMDLWPAFCPGAIEAAAGRARGRKTVLEPSREKEAGKERGGKCETAAAVIPVQCVFVDVLPDLGWGLLNSDTVALK